MKVKKFLSALISGGVLLSCSAGMFPVTAANYNRVGVHDPSIVKLEDGSYYIAGSHLAAARSADMANWTFTANSEAGTKNTTFFKDIYTDLAVPASWSSPSNPNYDLSGNLWAPDIIYNKAMGKYCMYLSINGDSYKSSIILCTADDIDGPYIYTDTIVYSGFENNDTFSYKKTDVEKVLGKNPDISRYLDKNGNWNPQYGTNAIDPAVFYDESGKLWMIYGSWFGGLFMLELDENTGLRDYNVTYDTINDVSDAYMGIKAAGGHWVSGEGPYIEYMENPKTGKGYYYLFVSYGCFNNDGGYNMRVFRSENPTGPYVDQNGNSSIYKTGGDNIGGNIGMRLMSNYKWDCNDRPNKAQGHNSVLMDDDGRLFVIYHNKFDDPYGFHEVRVHQLIMNEDDWVIATPYEYVPDEEISVTGHTMEAVTGEYEFIFHKLSQKIVADQTTSGNNAEVEYSKNIVLNVDGTVSGDIKGTWSMSENSADMTFTFDNVTYKGSFIVQADESVNMVKKMTFTASGNNTCIWGSKKSAYDFSEDMKNNINADSKSVYNVSSVQGTGSDIKLSDTELISGIPYYITNKFSGRTLESADGKTTNGTQIQQWGLGGGSHQEWRLVAVDDKYFKILSMKDESMCITVNGADGSDGLNIELQKYSGSDNQLFRLVQNGAFYGIVSKISNDKAGLDVYEWSEENGGIIKQWNYWGGTCQLWKIKPVRPEISDGRYTIKNLNSGLFISSDQDNVIQGTKENWNIAKQNDGTYIIQSENGKVLTVENNSDGANIFLEELTGDNSQKFSLYVNPDGSYALLSASSDNKSCVDVFGISLEDGANICQWNYWGGDGQKFILEPSFSAMLMGDVNADGKVNILDVILLQKWILAVPNTELANWKAGDFTGDGIINIFDFCLMKKEILKK
ncbi:MAG: RICIN domain-containing protein [Oscillospiraceae bacterium]|nr:RICIN domain-containing protein [Oscillospiraceae bacterium]